MARIARGCGGFETSSTDADDARAGADRSACPIPTARARRCCDRRDEIIAAANSRDQVLVGLGGGCRDIEVHVFADTPRGAMVVMHLLVDVRDAMGANTVNTMAEAVAPLVEEHHRRHGAAAHPVQPRRPAAGARAGAAHARGAGDARSSAAPK